MREYLLLYKSKNYNYYCNFEKNSDSLLRYLRTYFSGDDRYYKDEMLTRDQSHYNETIIVNNLENKNLYILTKDHDIDNHIPDDERHGLTNEFNSCKISVDNFKEFRKQWLAIKEALPSFAIIYRDNYDWIHCKGFNSKEEMELFVKSYQPEKIH